MLLDRLRQGAAERGFSEADGAVVVVAVFAREAEHFATGALRRAGLDHEVIDLADLEPPAVEPVEVEPDAEAPTVEVA